MALALSGFSATGRVALLVRFESGRAQRTGVNNNVHLWSTGGIAPAAGSILEGSVDYTPSTGGIASLDFTNVGTGYTAGNTLTASGGTGSGATVRVDTVNAAGAILTHTITAAGTGYTDGDTLTFTGGAGSGAAATVAGIAAITGFLRRVAVDPSENFIINRTPGISLSLADVVAADNLTVVRETDPVSFVTLEGGTAASSATGFARYGMDGGINATEWTFLNAIQDGDEFILAFHAGTASYTVPPEQVAMSANAGNPTAAFNANTVAPPTQEVSVSGRAGNPTASFNLSAVASPPQQVSMAARAGNPTAAFNASAVASLLQQVSMAARAGAPTVSFNASVVTGPVLLGQVSMSARAGGPVVAFDVLVVPPTIPKVVAQPFDRLDLIAGRVYPNVSLSEGIRMLIWANATGPLGERALPDGRIAYSLPLVFEGGEILNAPAYEAGDYGSINPLTPFITAPDVSSLSDVGAVDETTGGVAFDRPGELPYLVQLAVKRRLNTDYGRQLMRPNYGLRVDNLVGRPITEVQEIGAYVRESLADVPDVDETQLTITTTRAGRVDIRVAVEV